MKLIEKTGVPSLLVAGGVLIVLLGALAPWGRSGRTDRSSFELVRIARRLDVLEGALATTAKLWLLAPIAVAVVVVAAMAGWAKLAGVTGTAVAVAGVALAIAVRQSPLVARWGLAVTMAGAAVVVVADGLWFVAVVRGRAPRTQLSNSGTEGPA